MRQRLLSIALLSVTILSLRLVASPQSFAQTSASGGQPVHVRIRATHRRSRDAGASFSGGVEHCGWCPPLSESPLTHQQGRKTMFHSPHT